MIKPSKGQVAVLAVASLPMAAVGIAGAVATYINMKGVLANSGTALGIVAVGEGGTLVCALVALAVTLMGQHTPATVRAGLWLVPLVASGTGLSLARTHDETVTMAVTPLAMTVAGEGVAFVARRVVAYRTGTDIEQQRRSGLLLWHANRAANGSGLGRFLSKAAVWRLTRKFAETDGQLSVQLGEIQRFRISQGADKNLAAVLTGAQRTPGGSTAMAAVEGANASLAGGTKPVAPIEPPKAVEWVMQPRMSEEDRRAAESLASSIEAAVTEALTEAEATVKADPSVRLLTTAEVAKIKGVAVGTVRSWDHRGKLVSCGLDADGRKLYHPLDVDNLS